MAPPKRSNIFAIYPIEFMDYPYYDKVLLNQDETDDVEEEDSSLGDDNLLDKEEDEDDGLGEDAA